MKQNLIVELFHKKLHDAQEFFCGIETLDTYLKERARQEMRKRVTAVYVLHEITSRRVIGYYSLSASSLALGNLSEKQAQKLPKYKALPVILLGRLAVDKVYQGKKLGGMLLMDALSRAYALSEQIGSYAVIVDAKDERSRTSYEKYGFISIAGQPLLLYLPMETIKDVIEII